MRSNAPSSAPDPFTLRKNGTMGGYFNVERSGKTLSSQTLNPALSNLIVIVAGQSNITNSFPTNYTPTNSTKVDNLDPTNGAIYRAADPMLGCSTFDSPSPPYGGSFMGRLGDKYITAGKDRVIFVPIGVGGSTVADWDNVFHEWIAVAVRRLAAKGMVADGLIWGQGESDTTDGTSQAAYTARLLSVIAKSRTAGLTCPWFVSQQSWIGGVTSSAVTAAQAAVVNHGSGIWAGPSCDDMDGTTRYDNTHFTDAGSDTYATRWKTALGLYGAPF